MVDSITLLNMDWINKAAITMLDIIIPAFYDDLKHFKTDQYILIKQSAIYQHW